ncbi:MAG: hypothetical protein PHT51_03730 [Patescibacteria group bacterium]|nr:hypothetical protein [Patescibacteria group bacterium]MDD4611374.1 hypothetical protein [Patescibacteria group bacterium]
MKKIILSILMIGAFACGAIFAVAIGNNISFITSPLAANVLAGSVKSDCILSLANTTFLKSYRLLVFTKINGAWPTKDGGYIVSGTTDPNVMMIPPDGFVSKLDKQGNIQWLKMLKTTNGAGVGNPRGEEDVQSIIELKNGGYVMASKVWGFITTAESSAGVEVNKILLTKLDKNGNLVWNKSFNAFVPDARNSLLETNDNGILFFTNISDLAPSKRGEDSEVYNDLPYASLKVIKLRQDGAIQWSKNIKNFIARKNDSFLMPTADGGFTLAGDFAQPNPENEPPYDFDKFPGLAKFDKDFNFKWAKSFEAIPLEMPTVIPKKDGGFEMGIKKIRQGAGLIAGSVRTPDNGYIVIGNLSSLSLMTDSMNIKNLDVSKGLSSNLVASKYSSSGALEWTKKLTLHYNEFTSPMTEFSIISTADNNILIVGSIGWADDDYRAKISEVTAQEKWYKEKYGEAEEAKDMKERSAQSQEDWKKVKAAIKIVEMAKRSAIFMMKTDKDLSPKWAKIVNPQSSATSYVVKATKDGGAIISGEYGTNVLKSITLGNEIYFSDGFIIKIDASGNVKNNKDWVTDYQSQIITEMMTPYSTSNDLTVQVKNFLVRMTNRKPEFSLYKKSKTTTYAAYNSSKDTLCPLAPNVSASETPLQNTTSTSTTQRTWPQINYERAVPGELLNDKSRTINSELLPIFNKLFNNQVKMTDNMGGAMLDYIFDRVITKDDITAIKTYLEGLGYKTQDERRYELTTYKPGYWLVITFSTDNADKAFIQVTF